MTENCTRECNIFQQIKRDNNKIMEKAVSSSQVDGRWSHEKIESCLKMKRKQRNKSRKFRWQDNSRYDYDLQRLYTSRKFKKDRFFKNIFFDSIKNILWKFYQKIPRIKLHLFKIDPTEFNFVYNINFKRCFFKTMCLKSVSMSCWKLLNQFKWNLAWLFLILLSNLYHMENFLRTLVFF